MAIINKLPSGSAREQVKTVTAETSTITVTPDLHYLLSQVTVNPTPSEQKTRAASTSNVVVNPTAGKLLSQVTITPTPSETKTATPTMSSQNITPSSGKLLSKVTVNAMPNKYFHWVTTRNTNGNGTLTSGALTVASASATQYYSMAEAKFSDSASSATANGTVILQGSNNNSSWTNVKTLSWTTGSNADQHGSVTGYKYYRFQLNVTTTGAGWSKISASGFILYA